MGFCHSSLEPACRGASPLSRLRSLRLVACLGGAGMERKDWLALCAVHGDAWLMALVFFYAARFADDGRCAGWDAGRGS